MTPIADVEMAGFRHALGKRRPIHTPVMQGNAAPAARFDPVPSCRESLGKRDERRLGAAEGAGFGAQPVKSDAVIGHHDACHQRGGVIGYA